MNDRIQIIRPTFGDVAPDQLAARVETFWDEIAEDARSVVVVEVFNKLSGVVTVSVFGDLHSACTWAHGTGEPCVVYPKRVNEPDWGNRSDG